MHVLTQVDEDELETTRTGLTSYRVTHDVAHDGKHGDEDTQVVDAAMDGDTTSTAVGRLFSSALSMAPADRMSETYVGFWYAWPAEAEATATAPPAPP